ncbi:hypothetical protein GQ457_15G016540 [Hibiscus cannabinus]
MIFIFSSSDMEDSQYCLGSVEGDSEMQYTNVVNGMDLGSRKNSIAASASENNLDELLGLNVVREASRTMTEAAASSVTSLASNASSSIVQYSNAPASTVQSSNAPSTVQSSHATSSSVQTSHVPSPTLQSSQPVLVSSSSAYESGSQPYLEQKMCHGEASQQLSSIPQINGKYGYGSQPSNYVMPGENLVSMPVHVNITPQVSLGDIGYQVQDSEVSINEVKLKRDSPAPKIAEPEKERSLDKVPSIKEPKLKRDASLPKISETEKVQVLEKDYNVPSNAYESSVANYISSAETSITIPMPDIDSSSCMQKFSKRPRKLGRLVVPEVITEWRKNVEDDCFYTSSGLFTSSVRGSKADLNDFCCLEPSVIPQRVFHSERIPREQAEMNRLSNYDDSFWSQFLMTHAHSDSSQIIREEVDKIHDGNLSPLADQSVTSTNPRSKGPQTIMNGLAKFERYKGFVDKTISNISKEVESIKEKSKLKQVSVKNTADEEAFGLNHPTSSQKTYVMHLEDHSLKSSTFERIEKVGNKNTRNHSLGHNLPLVCAENPIKAISNVQPTPSNLYGISPFPGDGAGLSLNMENHEPKHWSYFRNFAQDEFVRKDVSLMDQDHLGFSSPLANIDGEASIDYSYPPLKSVLAQIKPYINFGEDIRQESTSVTATNNLDIGSKYKKSPLKGDESAQVGENLQVPEYEFEDRKLDIRNTGVPLVDHSRGDFNISTLQLYLGF